MCIMVGQKDKPLTPPLLINGLGFVLNGGKEGQGWREWKKTMEKGNRKGGIEKG